MKSLATTECRPLTEAELATVAGGANEVGAARIGHVTMYWGAGVIVLVNHDKGDSALIIPTD
jgi:hypothetical protein